MTALNPRSCTHCATPLPAGRRRDARYCDAECKNAARGATASKQPAIPAGRPLFRVRTAAELEVGAARLIAAYERRDRQAVLAMEAQLLDGEISDMLAALVGFVLQARSGTSPVSPT